LYGYTRRCAFNVAPGGPLLPRSFVAAPSVFPLGSFGVSSLIAAMVVACGAVAVVGRAAAPSSRVGAGT
jgi:hypothetical protein